MNNTVSDDATPYWTVRCNLGGDLCAEDKGFAVIVAGSYDVTLRYDDSVNAGNGEIARVSTGNNSPNTVAQLTVVDGLLVLQLTSTKTSLDVVLLRREQVQRVVSRGSGDVTVAENVLTTSGPSLTIVVNGSGNIRVQSQEVLAVVDFSLSSQSSGRIEIQVSEFEVKTASIQVLSSGDITVFSSSTGSVDTALLSVLGSGSLCMSSLEMSHLKIKKVGSGDISLGPRGSCQDAELSTAGSGTIDIGGVQCENVNVNLLSSGDVIVQTTGSLSGDVYGSGHLNYYGEAPNSVDNTNYMGLVTAKPVSSTYRPAECKMKSMKSMKLSPLLEPATLTPSSSSETGVSAEFDYNVDIDKSHIIYLSGVVFVVALILRWFNESRRRAREEQRQPLLGAGRRVYV